MTDRKEEESGGAGRRLGHTYAMGSRRTNTDLHNNTINLKHPSVAGKQLGPVVHRQELPHADSHAFINPSQQSGPGGGVPQGGHTSSEVLEHPWSTLLPCGASSAGTDPAHFATEQTQRLPECAVHLG